MSGFPTDRRRSGCRSESHQPRALRTRCKQQPSVRRRWRQGGSDTSCRNLRFFLFTQIKLREAAHALETSRKETGRTVSGPQSIRRAGSAFVHRPDRPFASAYSCSGRLRPTGAPCSAQAGLYAKKDMSIKAGSRRISRKLRSLAPPSSATLARAFRASGRV